VFDPFAAGAVGDVAGGRQLHNAGLERDYSTGGHPAQLRVIGRVDLPVGAGRSHQLHGVIGAIATAGR